MAEILTIDEMTAADRAAIAGGTAGSVLMERAGTAVADAVRARFKPSPVVVWVGPGNNGGDGYVAARLLRKRGWPVRVEVLEAPRTADARQAAARWRGETAPLTGSLGRGAIYIDSLFGAGLQRPLEGRPRPWRGRPKRRAPPLSPSMCPAGCRAIRPDLSARMCSTPPSP
jgi:NAD(P)H-hydrate repair Nnr-like enzyme with NAD(P)H-hydrate epimerase domain